MTEFKQTIAIKNANVVDTRAGRYLGARNIRIEDGRICEISETSVGDADRVIDLDGKT